MKTAIVTDSTAYLPAHKMQELDIRMIPLTVTIDGNTYDEEIDISATDFYDKVRGDGPLPKTSQPPIGKFVELFESLKGTYDAVISIHLSSGISGTYAGAGQAGDMVDGIDVYPFDSEISCYMQGFYVLRAAEMAQQGETPDAIMQELAEMKTTMRAYFMADDLTHLQRGGRLNGAQAFIGGLLQVKPLLHFKDKIIVPFEKIRTRKKAMKRIADMLAEDAAHMPLEAAIIHANRPEDAAIWQETLSAELPEVQFTISHFGPVIGTHLGEGAMGLGWVKRKAQGAS
ncbi:DegV family protein [Filibacter tadaridae]|uniref:DegV domain-containing protein n=1 Tax=Filibacter tadaridae TaxID=2483811 RepID=A0A3P5X9C1_9BACL|nr:DegV family protein [Filibacter tadaridae]VDC24014.1 DegV domain-containing protein [Filibacter tadaridae]